MIPSNSVTLPITVSDELPRIFALLTQATLAAPGEMDPLPKAVHLHFFVPEKRMPRLATIFIAGLVFGLVVLSGSTRADQFRDSDDEEALKSAAVSRLARSLDPALPIALGKAVVRQAALLRARELLASHGRIANLGRGWNATTPEWRQAESALTRGVAELIESRIETPDWFYAVLDREIDLILNGEEADYIATHFTTIAGNEQRILLEMRLIGEVLMANYTFTNRIDYNVPGLEDDMNQISSAYWALEPFRTRDFMNDPQAIRFAGQSAGLKYTRMLAIRGIEGFIDHIDTVATLARQSVDQSEGVVELYIDAYRKRTHAGG